jgi:hypothetical protein
MLPADRQREIIGLRQTTAMRFREIAASVGVARESVALVVRRGYVREAKASLTTQSDGTPIPRGPAQRCSCGALTQMPCLACYLRSLKKKKRGGQVSV